MGKNKLDMVGKKTKHKKKKLTKKDKQGIVDVPLAKELSLGSKASIGSIDYHYQKYYNTFAFLKEIIKKNKKLQDLVCIPNIGSGWMQSFLKVNFFKGIEGSKAMDSIKPVTNVPLNLPKLKKAGDNNSPQIPELKLPKLKKAEV